MNERRDVFARWSILTGVACTLDSIGATDECYSGALALTQYREHSHDLIDLLHSPWGPYYTGSINQRLRIETLQSNDCTMDSFELIMTHKRCLDSGEAYVKVGKLQTKANDASREDEEIVIHNFSANRDYMSTRATIRSRNGNASASTAQLLLLDYNGRQAVILCPQGYQVSTNFNEYSRYWQL
jgi:hypothetical protein